MFTTTTTTTTTAGAAAATTLRAGFDPWGFIFTTTIADTLWTGSFTKVATANSAQVESGSFAANLGIARH